MNEITKKNLKPDVRESLDRMEKKLEELRADMDAKYKEFLKASHDYNSQLELYKKVIDSVKETKCN